MCITNFGSFGTKQTQKWEGSVISKKKLNRSSSVSLVGDLIRFVCFEGRVSMVVDCAVFFYALNRNCHDA